MVLDSDSCYNGNKNNDEMEDNVRITSMGSGEVSVNWFVCWEWKEIRKESDMLMYQEGHSWQNEEQMKRSMRQVKVRGLINGENLNAMKPWPASTSVSPLTLHRELKTELGAGIGSVSHSHRQHQCSCPGTIFAAGILHDLVAREMGEEQTQLSRWGQSAHRSGVIPAWGH